MLSRNQKYMTRGRILKQGLSGEVAFQLFFSTDARNREYPQVKQSLLSRRCTLHHVQQYISLIFFFYSEQVPHSHSVFMRHFFNLEHKLNIYARVAKMKTDSSSKQFS